MDGHASGLDLECGRGKRFKPWLRRERTSVRKRVPWWHISGRGRLGLGVEVGMRVRDKHEVIRFGRCVGCVPDAEAHEGAVGCEEVQAGVVGCGKMRPDLMEYGCFLVRCGVEGCRLVLMGVDGEENGVSWCLGLGNFKTGGWSCSFPAVQREERILD